MESEYGAGVKDAPKKDDELIAHLRWLLIPLALLVVVYLGVQGFYARTLHSVGLLPGKPVILPSAAEDAKRLDIRNFDLAAYLGKTEYRDCIYEYPDAPPVVIEQEGIGIFYTDLTGDGREEAVVSGWSCWSGTGGPDVRGVFMLSATGTPERLPIEDHRYIVDGVNYSDGFAGHQRLRVRDGRLIEIVPVYRRGDGNCCPEGGSRTFVYRWDGSIFVVQSVEIERPPASTL